MTDFSRLVGADKEFLAVGKFELQAGVLPATSAPAPPPFITNSKAV
jgi:hypothetical protein